MRGDRRQPERPARGQGRGAQVRGDREFSEWLKRYYKADEVSYHQDLETHDIIVQYKRNQLQYG